MTLSCCMFRSIKKNNFMMLYFQGQLSRFKIICYSAYFDAAFNCIWNTSSKSKVYSIWYWDLIHFILAHGKTHACHYLTCRIQCKMWQCVTLSSKICGSLPFQSPQSKSLSCFCIHCALISQAINLAFCMIKRYLYGEMILILPSAGSSSMNRK